MEDNQWETKAKVMQILSQYFDEKKNPYLKDLDIDILSSLIAGAILLEPKKKSKKSSVKKFLHIKDNKNE